MFSKENIFDSAHVIPNTNENSVWIKLKKRCPDSKDLFIGSYYVSPANKKYKLDFLKLLHEESKRFQGKGDIIIQGDFNGRTGLKNDFIQPDAFLDDLFGGSSRELSDFLPPRNSEDNHSNARGEELLDFCISNEFAIVNGRKIGDLFGKCTSHQYNGSSVVDCVLAPIAYFEKISHFKVGSFTPWLSDHTPIFSNVNLNTQRKDPESQVPLHGRDQGYIWDDDSEEQFKAFLSSQRVKLENINHSTRINFDANKLANEMKNSILEASKKCNLKLRKKRKNTESTTPWFDRECLEMKNSVREVGKKLQADTGNKEIRTELFEKKKMLKKMVRSKKRLYKRGIVREMAQCTNMNQKKYWNLLKKLEQKDYNTTQYVSPKNL